MLIESALCFHVHTLQNTYYVYMVTCARAPSIYTHFGCMRRKVGHCQGLPAVCMAFRRAPGGSCHYVHLHICSHTKYTHTLETLAQSGKATLVA